MSVEEIMAVVEENGFDVTLTGGDPLFQAAEIAPLAAELRRRGYGVWCYTGYLYESIVGNPDFATLLEHVDVLVDGPFIASQRDIHLLFRGSANQRLIDLRHSTPGNVRLWQADELLPW